MHLSPTRASLLLAAVAAVAAACSPQGSGVPEAGLLALPCPGASFPSGGDMDFAWQPNTTYQVPDPVSTSKIDVGIQGPAPVIQASYALGPTAIREIATYDAGEGGPGGWINATISLPMFSSNGTYFLIVTEHQVNTRDSTQLLWRTQTYNQTLMIIQ